MSWNCDFAGCGCIGNTKPAYYKHRRKHDESKKQPCAICSKVFTDTSDFKRHQLSHEPRQQNFWCSCARGYANNQGLLKHFKNMNVSAVYATHTERIHHRFIFRSRNQMVRGSTVECQMKILNLDSEKPPSVPNSAHPSSKTTVTS